MAEWFTDRSCLTASPAFGPLAVPLFMEKLIAGTPTTKVGYAPARCGSKLTWVPQRDTLQTLDEALPVYGPSTARNHARKLWNSLKLEVGILLDVRARKLTFQSRFSNQRIARQKLRPSRLLRSLSKRSTVKYQLGLRRKQLL